MRLEAVRSYTGEGEVAQRNLKGMQLSFTVRTARGYT